jgi:hypothetical protein
MTTGARKKRNENNEINNHDLDNDRNNLEQADQLTLTRAKMSSLTECQR